MGAVMRRRPANICTALLLAALALFSGGCFSLDLVLTAFADDLALTAASAARGFVEGTFDALAGM